MEKLSKKLNDVLEETIECISEIEQETIDAAIDRLAAYEETGLEPKKINRLIGNIVTCYDESGVEYFIQINGAKAKRVNELIQADDNDRCVILPVAVGSQLYFVNRDFNEICPAIVTQIEINFYTPQCPIWLKVEWVSQIVGKQECHNRSDLMIGKKVFFTRKEAIAALKKV